MKDTLYFRTEFKGGEKGEDYYNLNLYHTINKDNNNVVGISKSEVKFKDYLWFLNEKETPNNIAKKIGAMIFLLITFNKLPI